MKSIASQRSVHRWRTFSSIQQRQKVRTAITEFFDSLAPKIDWTIEATGNTETHQLFVDFIPYCPVPDFSPKLYKLLADKDVEGLTRYIKNNIEEALDPTLNPKVVENEQ